MPVTRLVNLNGSAGAFTAIAATIPARSVEIVEDGAVAAQGLQVQFPGDGFTVTDTYGGGVPVEITGAGRDGLARIWRRFAARRGQPAPTAAVA